MDKATQNVEGRKGIRIIEIATIFAVLGILASLAIPSLFRMQARSRVDRLLASARSCREELPRWLSTTVSHEPQEADAGGEGSGEGETGAFDPRSIFEDYARIHNEGFQLENTPGEEPLLVVEPAGTSPAVCRRDGRIHIIPFVYPTDQSIGAKVVVTDENRISGPNYDGILAVFSIRSGGGEGPSVDERSRGSTRHETQ